MIERTLAIIKPCAVKNKQSGEIISDIECSSILKIVESKLTYFSVDQAEEFYCDHFGKPFYDGLIKHTLSGPVWALILEGENAVGFWRRLIGPTDPSQGAGLRSKYGTGVPENALHGSDSEEAAENEISIMFPELIGPEEFPEFWSGDF